MIWIVAAVGVVMVMIAVATLFCLALFAQARKGSLSPLKLALRLLFLKISESMGNHDSKIVDADSVD